MKKKSLLILSAISILSLTSQISFAQSSLGNPGRSGSAGATGSQGSSASSQEIHVNGQPQRIILRGSSGGPGGPGYDAEAATCWAQPIDFEGDLIGADGGRGGDAGRGGRGGDGGNITVYYDTMEQLKNVYVDLSGGPGGPGSNSVGYGQPGCHCTWSNNWVIHYRPYCHEVQGSNTPITNDRFVAQQQDDRRRPGQPPQQGGNNGGHGPGPGQGGNNNGDHHDQGGNNNGDHQGQGGNNPPPPPPPRVVCDPVPDRYFSCTDGRNLGNGDFLGAGDSGNTGSVTLIPNSAPKNAAQPSAVVSVSSLPGQLVLNEDIWRTSGGASTLFANGSVMVDTFRQYVERKFTPVTITWNASRPASTFANSNLNLNVSNGSVAVNSSSDLWANFKTTYDQNGAALVNIDKAIFANEAAQLSANDILGADQNVTVTINDAARMSNLVDTQIHAQVCSAGFWECYVRADQVVPDNLITKTDSSITIQISKLVLQKDGKTLPIPTGDLKSKKHLKIKLVIVRALGLNQTTLNINLDKDKLGQNGGIKIDNK